MLELPHEGIVILLGDAFRIARHRLYVWFQRPLQQLVNLRVVVIIVSDSEHTMYVVPDGPTEGWRINIRVITHTEKNIMSRYNFLINLPAALFIKRNLDLSIVQKQGRSNEDNKTNTYSAYDNSPYV